MADNAPSAALPATAPFVRRTYQYASAVAGGRLAPGAFFAISNVTLWVKFSILLRKISWIAVVEKGTLRNVYR